VRSPPITFWQAFKEAALIAAKAFTWMLLPASVGLLGGYLLSMGWFGLLACFVVAVLLAALALQARSIQHERNRSR
jgi:hypothetical protein